MMIHMAAQTALLALDSPRQMGWFGKIVGGGVGALIGGPAGAVVGFGLGTLYDSAASSGAKQLDSGLLANARATTVPDEVGVQIVVKTSAGLPESALCGVTFFTDGEKPLSPSGRSGDRYRSEVGQLIVAGRARGNTISAYLPAGAMPSSVTKRIHALVNVGTRQRDGSVVALGQMSFLMDAPEPRRWCQVELIEPLVVLGMRVARADGKLVREEIRAIRAHMERLFELEAADQEALRAAMKATKPWLSNHLLLDAVHRRLPGIEMEQVLDVLVQVARCDGVVSASEVEIIRELTMGYYGATRADWAEAERALGIEVARVAAGVDHWAVLSVSRGATRIEIKKAYYAKMREHHPDKVANLPKEFQELAHEKTIEIRASYEALLRVVG